MPTKSPQSEETINNDLALRFVFNENEGTIWNYSVREAYCY